MQSVYCIYSQQSSFHLYVLSESFMHLPLRPIFRQSHPNFINVRTAYASKIWAQLTKNLLAKIKYKKIPRVHNMVQEDKYMKIPGNREQNRSNAVKEDPPLVNTTLGIAFLLWYIKNATCDVSIPIISVW